MNPTALFYAAVMFVAVLIAGCVVLEWALSPFRKD